MAVYMITIHEDEAHYADADMTAVMKEHDDFTREVGELGAKIVGGEALEPFATATFLRGTRASGVSVVDNPDPAVKEVFGGFYLIEAASDDLARQVAERCPAPFGYISFRKVCTELSCLSAEQ